MKLEVTPKAQQWFKEKIGVQPKTGIRFFEETYRKAPVHDGFSIAMSAEMPGKLMIKENLNGVIYFVEEADDWFFKGYGLVVDCDEKNDEPRYQFEANQEDLAK